MSIHNRHRQGDVDGWHEQSRSQAAALQDIWASNFNVTVRPEGPNSDEVDGRLRHGDMQLLPSSTSMSSLLDIHRSSLATVAPRQLITFPDKPSRYVLLFTPWI